MITIMIAGKSTANILKIDAVFICIKLTKKTKMKVEYLTYHLLKLKIIVFTGQIFVLWIINEKACFTLL
ncbi:MAG: hypothetical protein ACJASL_003787 [Paraglaciecola sp.]|jgi:hypothetical protein